MVLESKVWGKWSRNCKPWIPMTDLQLIHCFADGISCQHPLLKWALTCHLEKITQKATMFSDNNEDSFMSKHTKVYSSEKQIAIKTSDTTTGSELSPKSEEPCLFIGRR